MNVSLALAMVRAGAGDNCRWSVAAPRGMAVAHPFLDPRLVCLCLGIQARFRQSPAAMKPLLAEAMRNVLPESIRTRHGKGHYNCLTQKGLSRHLPMLEALVRQAPAEAQQLFDPGALLRCLRQAALGLTTGDGLGRLHVTLAWLRWHSLQDQWQRALSPVTIVRASAGAGAPALAG
jgi:asparagine synthase (glutamine-hydrolysing)